MQCLWGCVLMTLVFVTTAYANHNVHQELRELNEALQLIKTKHLTEITRLTSEIQQLKHASRITNNHERNEKATLEWATTSMRELRIEMKELGASINSSSLLRQLHVIRNELKQALMETNDLAQLARTQETRVDKLDNDVGRLKYEDQQLKTSVADVRSRISKISKEIKTKQLVEFNDGYNEVLVAVEPKGREMKGGHKIRHNKMMHTQISRLAKSQDQLDEFQQSLQTQILDVQRRLDRYEEPNWNLLSAKVDMLELENKVLRNTVKNMTQKIQDFDKVHASILELREDVESIENKVDKTIPEFRKEISKLDMNYAQMNAHWSYLKEDQENLRQSVKAIAVSISNAVDRAEQDRVVMSEIKESVSTLQKRAKEHSFRLNDHILKTEANNTTHESNATDVIVSLPELISEVKELQPVEREYNDLVAQLPKDCSSISGPPGTYLIHPGTKPIDTWCVNGDTLLQRRYNGTIEFNRKFGEYERGFGNPASEFWIGLESMHQLTADNCSSMRIDMTDIYGASWYAEYDHFNVGHADAGYVLDVSGFKGNASDAFEYQNHMEFSAIDRDRDISNTHCAGNYEGGWWFSHCQHVNINGKYTLGLTWFDAARNEWIAIATSEMRLFRRPGCA